MNAGLTRILRKRQPRVFQKITSGEWEIIGTTGSNHIWLRHVESGRRLTAGNSLSCHHGEMNLVKRMERFERGEYR